MNLGSAYTTTSTVRASGPLTEPSERERARRPVARYCKFQLPVSEYWPSPTSGRRRPRAQSGTWSGAGGQGWSCAAVVALRPDVDIPTHSWDTEDCGSQDPALKVAMPEAQYMADPKLPVKLCAPGVARTRTPVITVAILVPVVVSWGWVA